MNLNKLFEKTIREGSDYDPEWVDQQARFILYRDYVPLMTRKLSEATNPEPILEKMYEYIIEFAKTLKN